MNPVLIIASVMLVGMLLALVVLFRRLGSSGSSLPVTAEWIEELSMEPYRPMMRLLNGQDLEFLRSQPGFTPAMATRLRAQRCQVFRGYLRRLNADFGRVCTALKLVMLHSGTDRPDLASVLVNHQLMFAYAMSLVHVRLLLYRWGLGSVDVASLVKLFDVMRLELQSMVPMAEAAGA
jgi:hypothetical protein